MNETVKRKIINDLKEKMKVDIEALKEIALKELLEESELKAFELPLEPQATRTEKKRKLKKKFYTTFQLKIAKYLLTKGLKNQDVAYILEMHPNYMYTIKSEWNTRFKELPPATEEEFKTSPWCKKAEPFLKRYGIHLG